MTVCLVHADEDLRVEDVSDISLAAGADMEPRGQALDVRWKHVLAAARNSHRVEGRRMTRLADWLPEPLTVPTRIARSLTVGGWEVLGHAGSFFDRREGGWHDVLAKGGNAHRSATNPYWLMPRALPERVITTTWGILGVNVALSRLVHQIPRRLSKGISVEQRWPWSSLPQSGGPSTLHG